MNWRLRRALGGALVFVPVRPKALGGPQIALEGGQHERPAAADAFERLAAGLETVVNDGEPDLILLLLELEGNARWRLSVHAAMLRMERIGEPPRRIVFEHLAGDIGFFALELERERRADLPVGDDAVAGPVLLRHFSIRQRREDFFGRRGDVDDIDEFRLTHCVSPVVVSICRERFQPAFFQFRRVIGSEAPVSSRLLRLERTAGQPALMLRSVSGVRSLWVTVRRAEPMNSSISKVTREKASLSVSFGRAQVRTRRRGGSLSTMWPATAMSVASS